MAITLAQICNAIESTIGAAANLNRTQSYDELSEGIHGADMPLLQVYPESNTGTDATGNTDRTTFGGSVRQKIYLIHADVYGQQRAHIGEDMKSVVDVIDQVENILEQQDTKPYFGLSGIKAWSWSWTRVTFVYGDPRLRYAGVRFLINVRVF